MPTPQGDQEKLKAAVVRARLRRAAVLVEEAQHTLEAACRELSTIIGGRNLWGQSSKLSERARALWDKCDVAARSSGTRYKLDHEPSDYDRRDFPDLFIDPRPTCACACHGKSSAKVCANADGSCTCPCHRLGPSDSYTCTVAILGRDGESASAVEP